MKNRKPVVISESVSLVVLTYHEMVRLAFGDASILLGATIKFNDRPLLRGFDYTEICNVHVSMRVSGQANQKWVANFYIAKNKSGRWVRAKGWYLSIVQLDKQPHQPEDPFVFSLDDESKIKMLVR